LLFTQSRPDGHFDSPVENMVYHLLGSVFFLGFLMGRDAMQIPLMMMLALTNLGCHNKPSDGIDGIPLTGYQVGSAPTASYQVSRYATSAPSGSYAGTPYPDIPSRLYARPSLSEPIDWHTELQATFCSFFLGRDPDVTTVREIEESVYGVDSGHEQP
jgi:hypothetical protein